MIQSETRLKIIDNTGAKEVMCITVLRGYKRRYAGLGDIIVATIKKAAPHTMVKKGEIVRVVIVRTKKKLVGQMALILDLMIMRGLLLIQKIKSQRVLEFLVWLLVNYGKKVL